jgi:hypothetical protein
VEDYQQTPQTEQLKKLARFRLSIIQANPIRKWEIDGKIIEFKRGSNNSKGLYMSNLGAYVRHIFYDKKTQILYELDSTLNRKHALIEDPDFLKILAFEWKNNLFYSPLMPSSLEYLARIYKYLIQNVIEPDLELDHLRGILRNFILSSFGILTVNQFAKANDLGDPEHIIKKRDDEYRKFGLALHKQAEKLQKYMPMKAKIISDLSDYSLEEEYKNSALRNAALRKVLGI